ncbi:sporulation and spore germination protein [Haloactinopolyspora alba]|uniref:Sporulation and spore germination protein n=1 Tax=Haloactinopolyspora alba TaxID=648780 RepID=A0A2P8DL01_9ACTN|nr:LpqB family beta-propeller domain-containing protein [Haloactinopolyspora alba]PSK97904.1 sporulation and spore germination protein [Haloactinopolyspora alba]
MAERHRRALLAFLTVLAVLTGCTQIPTSGPVIGGNPVEPAGQQPPFIEVRAPPPQSGAEPSEVVDGFIEAMGSYAPGFETARMYLTEDAVLSWDTSAGMTVYQGARPDIEEVRTGVVRVTMAVSARVSADGTYEAAEPGTTDELSLRLEQENGEWRISNPPNGLVISEFSFSREYKPHNVYFFDPTLEVLVPDPVYLPQNENAATLLAQRVLAGPSEGLGRAVRTSFPESTELGVNAVPVTDGTATVELSDDAGLATPEERELMTAQLVWTLTELPEVERVEVTSGQIPLAQGGAVVTPSDSNMSAYAPPLLPRDTPLYYADADGIKQLSGSEPEPVPGPLGELSGARELAVNVGGNRAVAVNEAGDALLICSFGADEQIETFAGGGDLTSPAWDRAGLVWAVDHGVQGHGVVVRRSDGERVELIAPELRGHDVDRLAVSLDGTRIALIVDGRAQIATVVRDVDARSAIRLERLRPLGPDGVASDVGWNAPDSVVVLLATDGQEPLPYVVGMSGQVTAPRGLTVENATSIATAPLAEQRLVLETSEGVLLEQRSGNRWEEIGTGHDPAFPG